MADDQTERLSQLKRGFNRLARDLDRAYALARLSPAQALLLQAVRDESWRYRKEHPDRTPVRVRPNLSSLARISGFNRSGLSVQLNLLCRRSFLLGDPKVAVEPNKNYRQWLNSSGNRLLTETQIKWCLRANRNVRTVEPAQHAGAVNSTPPCLAGSTGVLSQLNTPVELAQHPRTTVARAGRTFKNLQESGVVDFVDQESAEVGVVGAGGGAGDLAGLQAWSDTLGPTQDLPPVVLAWSRSYPLDWIESALVCGLVTAPNRIAQYANACLARWRSRGGPPHAEVAAAVDQATASQAESFYDRQARERREQIARLVAQEATDGR